MALELVSSAFSFDSLAAAVRAGADAVSIISSDCGDISEGFSAEKLAEAIYYCRLRNKKAYVSIPVCVSDKDLIKLKKTVEIAYKSGADAISVCDMGLARVVAKIAPKIKIFGGESFPVRSITGAVTAQKLGFSRVMIAKEASLDDIKFIAERTDMELCVMIHGSMCSCVDGQCHFMSAVHGVPGQRGDCGYPCRMPYSYFGDAPKPHLTVKDACNEAYLSELCKLGIAAVYIDSRDKSAEYVALTTEIYKNAIAENRRLSKAERESLQSLYSRDGFTDAYLKGEKGNALFGIHSEATEREKRAALSEIRKKYITDSEEPTIGAQMSFSAKKNQKMTLYCRDEDGNEYTVSSPAAQPANRYTTREDVENWLKRAEDTVFRIDSCEVDIDDGQKITPIAVGAMRRQCLEGLANRRRAVTDRKAGNWQPGDKRVPPRETPSLSFSLLRTDQISAELLDFKPEVIYLPLWKIVEDKKVIETVKSRGISLCAVLDRVIFDREWAETLVALRELKKAGVSEILCTEPGQVAIIIPLGFSVRTDFGFNVTNSQSIKTVRDFGALSCTLSFELPLSLIRELSMSMDCEVFVYGRMPLMINENCIIHKRNGTHNCHTGNTALTDKTGRSYPLLPEKNCRNTLYNAEKLWLSDKIDDFMRSGASLLRFEFTTENSLECVRTVKYYLDKSPRMPERSTRGMYYSREF